MPPIFWRSTALPYHFLTVYLDLTSRNVRECFLLWSQESHTFITITLSCNNKAWELVSVWVLNYERGQGRRVILNRMIAHYGAQWDRLLFLSIRSPWGKIFKLSAACMPTHTHTPLLAPLTPAFPSQFSAKTRWLGFLFEWVRVFSDIRQEGRNCWKFPPC